MFYIEKRIKFSKREVTFTHIIPVVVVFLAFGAVTIWNWSDLRRSVEKKQTDTLIKNTDDTAQSLRREISAYIDVIDASAGLFEASDYVNHKEWKRFVGIFNLPERYPGINNIGYTKIIPADQLASYRKFVKKEEGINLKVRPGSNEPAYAPVVYAEPAGRLSRASTGYDMYANPNLREAMGEATDGGRAVITRQLSGDSDAVFAGSPQIIIFAPIFNKNSATATENQRRKNIQGYIYADISGAGILSELNDSANRSFAFSIREVSDSASPPLYKSPDFDSIISRSDGKLTTRRLTTVNNRVFIVDGAASVDIVPLRERRRPVAALWLGLLFSIFLAVFVYTILLSRTKALADNEEKEIKTAKDELLALASHQLRTPATGVKQYIGMLREGYGGKMTKQQQKFLDKAYASNERQLNTINDMLFVARADTGDIKFNFKRTDVRALLKDVIEEQAGNIRQNHQKLVKKLPPKAVHINADKAYLRMAIENILSNSTKYTKAGGTITVRLKKAKTNVRISIEDTGVGVKEKYRYLLFRKFSRIPNELSNNVTGSGLGLYLVKKVTVAHRGRIEFKSADEKGSNCTIILPLDKNEG